MPLVARAAGVTDVGRVRKQNQDSWYASDQLGLSVVADGMGGHAGGEIASAEAVDQVLAMVKRGAAAVEALRANPTEESRAGVRRVVEAAIQAATYMVFALAEQTPEQRGMGTTISCLVFVGHTAVIGQVGDSRVYLIRGGIPVQITEDHTLVNAQLKAGQITAEQAKRVPYQNLITRAVGVKDYVEVDTFALDCAPGDRFVLCSDGVHGYIESDTELVELCKAAGNQDVARTLVDHALARGGKDNATAIVIDIVQS